MGKTRKRTPHRHTDPGHGHPQAGHDGKEKTGASTAKGTDHRNGTDHQNDPTAAGSWRWRDWWRPEWVALLVIGIGLVIAPAFRGLYFDTDMLVTEALLFFLLLVTGVWLWVRQARARNGRTAAWYNPRHLFVFALLVPYAIGLWTAVAPYDNWMQLLRFAAYATAFFIVAEALSRGRGAADFLQAAIQLSIGWTALFAVAAGLGQVTYEDAVLDGRLASVFQYPNTFAALLLVGIIGGLWLTLRRAWWLQVLGGLFLLPMGYVFLLTFSRGAWIFFPFVYVLGLLLLPVRAQWAYLLHSVPLAAGVGLLLLVFGTNLEEASAGAVWTAMAVAIAAGAVGYPVLYRRVSGRLLGASLRSSAGEPSGSDRPSMTDRRPAVLDGRAVARRLALPAAVVAAFGGALLTVLHVPAVRNVLPDALAERVGQIGLETHSVIERGYFNRDAWDIFRDYPVFGAGGGGWRALFQSVQDYPYWSTQSHNFFSQLLVETGTVGLVVFAAVFLFYIGRGFRRLAAGAVTDPGGVAGLDGRNGAGAATGPGAVTGSGVMDGPGSEVTEARLSRPYFLVVAAALLGHSIIDFNMSYGYVGLLLFVSLAAWQADIPGTGRPDAPRAEAPARRLRSRHGPWPGSNPPDSGRRDGRRTKTGASILLPYARPAAGLVLLALAALMLFPAVRFAQADAMYQEAGRLLKDGDVAQGLEELRKAIRLSPDQPSYRMTYGTALVSIGMKQPDEALLEEGLDQLRRTARLAATHPQTLAQVAVHLMRAGEYEEAYRLGRQALEQGPWDVHLYPIVMELAYELGAARLAAGDLQGAADVWQEGVDIYTQVNPRKETLHDLPEALGTGREFRLTDEMRLSAGKLMYRLESFEWAADTVLPVLESGDETQRQEAALWGVAAQVWQGVPLEEADGYDILTQIPDWQNKIRQVLSLDTVGRN